MHFLIGLCAIIVIIVVFVGVSGRIPNVWEWVSIVLAGFGVVFGVPSGLQRIFGRAKLLREYDRYEKGNERGLIIFLKNPPLEKKSFMRRMGVGRETISSLSASFRIIVGKKILVPIMHCRIYTDDDPTDAGAWRIALPPTYTWSTSIMVAMWDDEKKKAMLIGDRLRSPTELSAGRYRMMIIYLVDGEPENEFRDFIVGKSADELVWI